MVQPIICNSWKSAPGLERMQVYRQCSWEYKLRSSCKMSRKCCVSQVWQWLKVAIITPTFLSIKPHVHLGLFFCYWCIQLLNCRSSMMSPSPSQFWLRSSNQSRTDLNSLKFSTESFFFTFTSSLVITKGKIPSASFSWSGIPWLWSVLLFYIKPVHLISSKGRLILGGLGDLIVSSPWCLSRSNTWVLRLLSWVPFPGPQLTIL